MLPPDPKNLVSRNDATEGIDPDKLVFQKREEAMDQQY